MPRARPRTTDEELRDAQIELDVNIADLAAGTHARGWDLEEYREYLRSEIDRLRDLVAFWEAQQDKFDRRKHEKPLKPRIKKKKPAKAIKIER